MNSPLEPETILQDRYLIVETIEQAERYRVYVAEDQQAGGENCILREFVASEVNEAVRIHDQFTPIIHQLQSLRHPQLEKFKDFLIQEKNLYLIQSYFEGQDYQTRLSGNSPLTEDEAIQLLRQALPALSYLHSQFVIHGDISPSHLLLRSPDGALIFTHFGLLQEIAAQMGIETAETKLLNRVEQLSVIPSGAAQDLCALAVTLLMLLTSKEPQDLFNRQTQSWDWENYRLLSDRLTDVINRMLSVNSTAPPPTADAILTILESVKIPPPTPPTPPLNLPNTPQLIPTEATSLPVSNTSFIPEPSKDLPKSIITGSIILGIFVLAGLALVRYLPPSSTRLPQPTQTPEPTSNLPQVPQSTPVSPAFPPPISPISPPSPTPFSPSPVQPSTTNNTNATIVGQPGKKNIRRGPGLEYSPRHIAYPGDRVQVIESARNSDNFLWYHIYFPKSGADGWIASNLLAVDDQSQALYQPPSQPQTQIQPPPKASYSGTNATIGGTPGTKNMRSGAGTAYGVVGNVRTGDRVQILGSSYDRGGYQWYKVYHPQSGTTGWIAAQLINSD
jgi:serine/threonine protein kinase